MSMADRDGFIWFDGKMVPWRDATTHVLTHSLHYGLSVFEGVRAYKTDKGTAIFRLREHTQRLVNSGKIYHMAVPYPVDTLMEAQLEVVRANKLESCYLRPIAFYGSEKMGISTKGMNVHVAIAAWPWGAYLGEEGLEKGIRVKTSSYQRHHVNVTMPRAKVASRPDDPGFFIEDFCCWQENGAYRRVIFDSPLAAAAGLLMASRQVRLYHDHMLTKEPGTRQRTPWHQDQPYYNIEGRQNVSFWIPVDPVRRHSTLEFVAGSHNGPWLMPRSFMDHQAKWFPEGSLQDLPDIEAARERFPIIGWPVEPGDVIAFHMLSLHASAGVDGDTRRRVFSVRMLGDDVTHAPRPWVTSPPFPGLADRLPAGAAMDDALFPVLWTS